MDAERVSFGLDYAGIDQRSFEVGEAESRTSLVRKAKEAFGLTGILCDTIDAGDKIEIRPVGIREIIYLSFKGRS